jgi:magnesium chelatase family protein
VIAARAHAIALIGVHGAVVEVVAATRSGPGVLLLEGLPDTALREARDRVRAAIINSQHLWPHGQVTVSVTPASLPKRGTSFDLGIAVAILAAAGSIRPASLDGIAFTGELGLDGALRPVPGVLPSAAAAAAAGFATVVVAQANLREALLVAGVRVVAPTNLAALADWLNGRSLNSTAVQVAEPGTGLPLPGDSAPQAGQGDVPERDLADVAGQPHARRAAEICAAGGHHLLLRGRAGLGRTLLAERIPSIMPDLPPDEALEVTAIRSVAGALPEGMPLVTRPPFIAPHHTATIAAIVGDSSGIIRPGAASLAHRGCLFLDCAPEFDRATLDALRQPIETGEIAIARAGVTALIPARFTLVLGADLCPCRGAAAAGEGACDCTPLARRRYLARLSGPLLDRVDLKITLLPVTRDILLADARSAEPGTVVAGRVAAARDRAARRLNGTPWRLNAHVPGPEIRRAFPPEPGATVPLERAMALGQVSTRSADRIVALSWTLADVAGIARPRLAEVGSALGLWLGVAP